MSILEPDKNNKTSMLSLSRIQVIYARVRIKTFDWVRRRRVIRKQIKRPTPLSFSFATAVECFDSDPDINEQIEKHTLAIDTSQFDVLFERFISELIQNLKGDTDR